LPDEKGIWQWVKGCPLEQIPTEAFDIVAAYNDFEKGIHPVSLGRATWLPGLFLEGMYAARMEIVNAHRSDMEKLKADGR